ncbi:MAG: cobalamin B12-binding domain-containing protein [Elusimicrobia bacterium]|nr:MAG: cobalamin B12-binding domain-containing protein [Elusimicrobiota bacterium]KAF0158446.1 MAG: cobalamin B12-binding domain-containing protein [Elusimicrobiota bacterium]
MFIKPYGDTLDDGAVQLSFTLPVACGGRAKEGARQYVLKLGFRHAEIVHAHPLSPEFTFFVAYARTDIALDYSKVEYAEAVDKSMTMDQVNDYIRANFKRKLVVIGACTGTDAHTVGIDAIMNMKGYNHHFGLERYPMIEALNLGSQVPNERLLELARRHKADAVLVSQIVTQKDVHIHNLTNLIELAEAEKLRDKLVMVIGGPRVNNKLAKELGYDAGFGAGTYAEDVATFIVKKLSRTLLKK